MPTSRFRSRRITLVMIVPFTPLFCQMAKCHHQKTPFSTAKEISAGEIQKNKAKGFSGGASGRVRPQALGLSLHGSAAITLEIGSRFFVDGSQISIKERAKTLALFVLLPIPVWSGSDCGDDTTYEVRR